MENINQKILRPIGTIIIGVLGLLGVFFFFNKIFIAILFGILILDAVSALMQEK